MYLVRLTWNGATVLAYATERPEGTANSEAGELMDSMADRFGDGFGYRVEPLHKAGPMNRADTLRLAIDAYSHGAWPPREAVPGCDMVARTAALLRRTAAELESGVRIAI
jgi:hypothetical protein